MAAGTILAGRVYGDPCPPQMTGSAPVPCGSRSSQLAELASGLGVGKSRDFIEGQNPLTIYAPEISWQTICWYDEARMELQYMGGPQASVSSTHQHYIYNEASNTWRTTGQALFPGNGHIWATAFDPETGDYFFKGKDSGSVVYWMKRQIEAGQGKDSSPWTSTSPEAYISDSPTQQNGMAWHPNLFGRRDGGLAIFSDTEIVAWRRASDTWTIVWDFGADRSFSHARNGSGLYLRMTDEVILGTGVDNNTLVSVAAGSDGRPGIAEVRGTTPLPISGRPNGGFGKILVHPRDPGRILILENVDNNRVWSSFDAGSTWSLDNQRHPFLGLDGVNNGYVAATVAGYGVIVGLSSRVSDDAAPTFRLWKPV